MSKFHGNDDECSACGLKYRSLNTGLTYSAVHDLMKDYSDDPADWKYKRRRTVLGKWHQLKQELWTRHKWECEQQRLFEESEKLVHGDSYVPAGVEYEGPSHGAPF